MLEVADDARIVAVGTGVELVPQVAHHDSSSKSEVFHFEDVVGRNPSEGHDLAVDNPLFACGTQLFGGEAGSHSCLGDAVEYRTQEYIVVEVLLVFQLVDGVAGATDVSCIVVWLLGVAGIQVDAQQVEFVLQVEMLVGDDAPMIFSGMRVSRRSEYMAGVSGLRKCRMSSPSSKRAVMIWSSSTKNVGGVTTISFISFAGIVKFSKVNESLLEKPIFSFKIC